VFLQNVASRWQIGRCFKQMTHSMHVSIAGSRVSKPLNKPRTDSVSPASGTESYPSIRGICVSAYKNSSSFCLQRLASATDETDSLSALAAFMRYGAGATNDSTHFEIMAKINDSLGNRFQDHLDSRLLQCLCYYRSWARRRSK
jgi:hypothetical protein